VLPGGGVELLGIEQAGTRGRNGWRRVDSDYVIALAGAPQIAPAVINHDVRQTEATLVPGVSVARVARTNGVNTNQLFTWRRLYLAGRLGEALSLILSPTQNAFGKPFHGTRNFLLLSSNLHVLTVGFPCQSP
jgi:Transposase